MSKILILKNIDREGPGLIKNYFESHNVLFDILEANDELFFDDFLNEYTGLIILGGPASANDKSFLIKKELEFITKWINSGKPYLGVCLGMQLMIKALGGEVYPNIEKEIGFYHLENLKNPYNILTKNLKKGVVSALPNSFTVFQLHGETMKHPTITSLGKSKWCNYQIVEHQKKQVGVQFHLELTEDLLKDWLLEDDFLVFASQQKYLEWFESHKKEMKENCEKILDYVFG